MTKPISLLLLAAALGFAATGSISATPAAQAADARLTAIRALSADVENRIALANKEAENQSPGGFYCSEVFLNSRNGSWRAVGNYYQKINFWHTDEPSFAAMEGKPKASVLVKAEVHEGAAVRTSYRDYLYDKGRLVFAFVKEKAGDGPFEERRYYFADGKLFRFQLGPQVKTEMPDVTDLLREAASLQARFLALYR